MSCGFAITAGRRRERGNPRWFLHPREGNFPTGIVVGALRLCLASGCVETASLCTSPSSSERPLGLCLILEMQEETKPLLGERSWAPSSAVVSLLSSQPVSLAAAEPTVEEKLQKLHSEVKFSLKVDNPVSAPEPGHGLAPPCSCPQPLHEACLFLPFWVLSGIRYSQGDFQAASDLDAIPAGHQAVSECTRGAGYAPGHFSHPPEAH